MQLPIQLRCWINNDGPQIVHSIHHRRNHSQVDESSAEFASRPETEIGL